MTTNWTKITKASGTSWTKVAKSVIGTGTGGTPIGMLMALTYSGTGGTWTKITKASGTSWTKIAKAT